MGLAFPSYASTHHFVIHVVVIIFAISLHECLHAWTARYWGDPTAYRLGRVTLNPVAHFDPVGFFMVLFGPIGWGKPVPVNPYLFRDLRKGHFWVSIAGVMGNLTLAVAVGMIFRVVIKQPNFSPLLIYGLAHMALVNVALAVFNLLPIYPLDGAGVLASLLPRQLAASFEQTRRYGMFILLGLIVTGLLGDLIFPPIVRLVDLVLGRDGWQYLF